MCEAFEFSPSELEDISRFDATLRLECLRLAQGEAHQTGDFDGVVARAEQYWEFLAEPDAEPEPEPAIELEAVWPPVRLRLLFSRMGLA